MCRELVSRFWRVVDDEGKAVDYEINVRRIGLDLELLRHTPELAMVGQGKARAPIMRIALLAGGVTTLVTDESIARAILLSRIAWLTVTDSRVRVHQ